MNDDPIRCNEDELVQLLRLSLAIGIVPIPDDPNGQTDVGLVRHSTTHIKRLLHIVYTDNKSIF